MPNTTLDPFLRQTLECSPLSYVIYQYIDGKIQTILASDGFYKTFHVERGSLGDVAKEANKIHSDDIEIFRNKLYSFARGEGKLDVYFRGTIGEEDVYHSIHAIGKHFSIGNDDLMMIWYNDVATMEDGSFVFDEKTYENTIGLISNYYDDELTGLSRMSNFLRLADNYLAAHKEDGMKMVVMAFDFSGMKAFNIKYGFEKGNNLLISFSKILKANFPNGVLSRFGEDHFYVMTENKDIEETLNKIFKEVRSMNDGFTLPLRVGIYDGPITNIARSCDKAKTASDLGQHLYVSHYNFYNDKFFEEMEKRDYIINNLDRALKEGWIVPYYQPIVRAINGKMCDEEALARWIDPDKGMISPADFIPVLENSRLIHKVDLCILDKVLEDFDKKKEQGIIIAPVSINISRSDFEACDIISEIKKRVVESGYPTSLITIEVTESIITSDKELLKEQINRLHKEGFKVWMDDFGSGYSSLNSLQDFEFDAIKIDMEFLSSFESNPKTPNIIRETIKIAEQLGVETVCEGVESDKERDFLLSCGCSKLQGYFYSKPAPIEEITKKNLAHIIGRENPAERGYYSILSSTSLDDPSVNGDSGTIAELAFIGPCDGILELEGDDVYLLRGSLSFIKTCQVRGFIQESKNSRGYKFVKKPDSFFSGLIQRCLSSGNWEMETVSSNNGNSTFMVRNIASNPTSGARAIVCIISAYPRATNPKSLEINDETIIRELIEPAAFPIPFIMANVVKNDKGEEDLNCVYANDQFCDLISMPMEIVKSATLKELVPNLNEDWVRLAHYVIANKKSVEGEFIGQISRVWLHYTIAPATVEGCVILAFTKIDKPNESEQNTNFEKTIYDEVYRISTIFKLKENHKVKLNHALYELEKSCNADEFAIVELGDDGYMSDYYEWCKEGVNKVMETLPFKDPVFKKFIYSNMINGNQCYVQEDINNLKDESRELYNALRSHGIKRFILVPLISKNKVVGLFTASNYEIDKLTWTKKVMSKLANIIAKEIADSKGVSKKQAFKDVQAHPFNSFSSFLQKEFYLGKRSTTEQQFINKENMRLARPTAWMFIIFETFFIPFFTSFVLFKKNQGSTAYYADNVWLILHLVIYAVFLLSNIALLVYASFYLNDKLNHQRGLVKRTRFIIDCYVSICNLFGILISAMDYQVGGQLIVFVMMTMYSFSLYRIHPFKATILNAFNYALLAILVYFAPLHDVNSSLSLITNFDASTATNLGALFILQTVLIFVLYRSRIRMVSASLIDRLSKTKLRYALEEDYKHLTNKPLVAMMVDIDDFKLLNDIYGHQAGDEIISKIGQALIETFGIDSVYRYGGDEFLVIKKGDRESFEKCLKDLQPNFDLCTSFETRITFSAGYEEATIKDYSSLERVIRESDLLLYEAKKRGKNQIVRGGEQRHITEETYAQ